MRTLTRAQHDRLDTLAYECPEARVVDWAKDSPVIEHHDGTTARVTPRGKLIPFEL